MIISNLQHIESATETSVQGGCKKCWKPFGGGKCYYNAAGGKSEAQAFGTDTVTSTTTDTLAIQGQFSGSDSGSFAEAF